MIIFTPNTVIRSTEVNSNFNELNTKIDTISTVSWQINNGTGTRSNAGAMADIAGSSYTYTPTQDVTVFLIMSCMIIPNTGATRVYINIAGSNIPAGMYFDSPHWQVQTLEHVFDVNANTATIIKGRWETTGTGTICNASTDNIYPSYFRMLIIPR